MTTKMQALFSKMNLEDAEEKNEKHQSNSHLMKLSGELRNEIYKLVALSEDARLWLVGRHCHATRPKPPAGIALIMTCKQIRREASEIVWDNMFLELEVSDDNLAPYASLGREGLWNSTTLRRTRNIRIHFELLHSPLLDSVDEVGLERCDASIAAVLLWNKKLKHVQLLGRGTAFDELPLSDEEWL